MLSVSNTEMYPGVALPTENPSNASTLSKLEECGPAGSADPSAISIYYDENTVESTKEYPNTLAHQILYSIRTMAFTVLKKLGAVAYFRDKLYLPLYNPTIQKREELRQLVAASFYNTLKNGLSNYGKIEELRSVQNHFSIYDMDACINSDKITRIFRLRVFESKEPINGKTLKVILFSFYGNKQVADGAGKIWKPSSIDDISKAVFNVMRALKEHGIKVDSMMNKSLGTMVLDGLKNIPNEEQDLLPRTLIIDRGFSSSKKVAASLYPFPINYLISETGRLSKWGTDPERELLNFVEREPANSSMGKRKIVIIEAKRDSYFSGSGEFHPDFHKQLEERGVDTWRGKFYPADFADRAHHAISLDLLSNNVASTIYGHSVMPIGDNETVADALTKEFFLNNDNEHHTCFCVGGNIETLDLQSRTVYPLLASFVSNAGKRASSALSLVEVA